MSAHFEYLIIGQGLAGSLLSSRLLAEGKEVMVVDPGHHGASSKIAAGIINPITGRRFVKSWRIDELIPIAKKTYQDLSDLLKCGPLYRERQILRILFSAGEENEWLARTSQDGWREYVEEINSTEEFEQHIYPGFNQGLVKGAQVDLPLLIAKHREYLLKANRLISSDFAVNQMDLESKQFKGITYDKIIFCEGAKARFNPLWEAIPFEPAKGEVFHLKVPGLSTQRLLKHKMMLAPLGKDLFWFGANNEWNASDDLPSTIGRNFLQKRLEMMLKNYEEVAHLAATRPTIRDRRPVLGQHPAFSHCYILNGLGTKGASLGPLLSLELTAHIINKEPLRPEIRVSRFY